MPNHIWLEFADGVYLAHLKNKRIDAVETVTGAMFGDICSRTIGPDSGAFRDADGDWVVVDSLARWGNKELVEVVRQGFIGGAKCVIDGVEKPVNDFQVNGLLASYLDDRPRVELWKLAAAILHATMNGYEPGEAEALKTGALEKTAETASSDPKGTLDT